MRADSLPSGRALLLAAFCVIATAGCWGSAPRGGGDVRVTDVILGRGLAPDGTIAEGARTNSFWLNDTFYVDVVTEGAAPSATVTARWTYQDGTLAGEATKTISPSGRTTTTLQASNPDLWKPGDYKVEVLIDGASAATKDLSARG